MPILTMVLRDLAFYEYLLRLNIGKLMDIYIYICISLMEIHVFRIGVYSK